METMALYIFLVLLIVMGAGTYYIATDIKEKSGWLYLLIGICGILGGLLLGFLRSNIVSGLQVGVLITLLYLFGGVMGRWQKQGFTKLERWYKNNLRSKFTSQRACQIPASHNTTRGYELSRLHVFTRFWPVILQRLLT
jgi:hypothetical protein